MNTVKVAGLSCAMICCLLAVHDAKAELIPSPDGLTVYDTILKVNWLANANYAAKQNFQLAGVNDDGSMDFKTAGQWVAALNGTGGGTPYLGHNNWTLPTSPTFPLQDTNCSATGPKPNYNSFGYGCLNSSLGSLYYQSLDLRNPDTAVPIPGSAAECWNDRFEAQESDQGSSAEREALPGRAPCSRANPFRNFQPYLYWSATGALDAGQGFNSFSFNTGFRGANVDKHYMYALPMITGALSCTHAYCPTYHPVGTKGLQVSDDGLTVYDPNAVYDPITGAKGVTWLADADLAKTETFGAQCVNVDGTLCINPDGSMTHTTALAWINGMNAYHGGTGWLGQSNWNLPPISNAPDPNCTLGNGVNTFGFGCTGNLLGDLYYNKLALTQGTPVVPTPHVAVGPFNHLQPYLYWACGQISDPTTCQVPAATGYEWSFSFGNGFQGTDVIGNNLYVMVFYAETPAQALVEAVNAAFGATPPLSTFLSQAAAIGSAANASAKVIALSTFIHNVNLQRGRVLSPAQANQLIALARTN